jgi:hypothetical protein
MWKRNLLFLGLVGGGLVLLAANLFPAPAPPRVHAFDPQAFEVSEFQSIVAQINTAFRRQWTEEHLQPAPPAPPAAVARRLSLALTGMIPSLQEIRQFEGQASDQRLPWWLAGIFQDRRYTDYLAERLARAFVGTEQGPFLVYRRRRFVSWLSDELMHNRSYQSLVRELIAADGIWTDRPATNFITVTLDPNNKNRPNPERLAGRVARAFLGIRLDCAQCHNHPFASWTQKDFQGLAAFFAQVEQGFTGIHEGAGELEVDNKKTGGIDRIPPAVPFLPELQPAEGTRRAQLADWLTDPRNPYFARVTVNRVWALMFGRPLVEPVDDIPTDRDPPRVLQLLAEDFAAHDFDLRRLIQVIAATEVFQLDSAADHEITEAHEKAWAVFPMTRLRPEQVVGSVVQAASLETINSESHILIRFFRAIGEQDFVKRYGDTGEDEFDGRGGTIPQRLLLMNGELVKEKTKDGLFTAATRIGMLAPDDRSAVETAYLAVLTRRPTPAEAEHFERRLAGSQGPERSRRMEDLYWALINSTEFAWNH